jgi:hypothetical protein
MKHNTPEWSGTTLRVEHRLKVSENWGAEEKDMDLSDRN